MQIFCFKNTRVGWCGRGLCVGLLNRLTFYPVASDGQQQSPFVASCSVAQLPLLHIVFAELQQHLDEVLLMASLIQLSEELHSFNQVPLCQRFGSHS